MFPFQGYVPSRTRPDHEPALLGGAVGGTVPGSCSGSHSPVHCACSPSPQSAPSGSSRRPHIWPHSAPAGQKQEQKEVTSQTSFLPNSPAQPTPSHLSVNTHPVSRGVCMLEANTGGCLLPKQYQAQDDWSCFPRGDRQGQ